VRTRWKIVLALGVFVLTAAALELGLRLAGFERPPPPPIVIWNAEKDWMLNGQRGMFVRDPDCLWIPRAGNPIRRPPIGVKGSDETVNAAGFRGPELALERTPGRLRVATLGDSSTFGFGVVWDDTYSARLVEELAARGIEAEVLDAGVVGYSVAQGVERYRRDVSPYRPDVVVAAFGAVNDAIPGRYDDAAKLALEHGHGWRSVERSLREHVRTLQLAAWLRERLAGGGAEGDDGVPRVSVAAFERALRELGELVRADGAELVLLSMPRGPSAERNWPTLPEYTAAIERLAAEEGWPLVDAYGLFRRGGDPEAWLQDHCHPTAEGHAHIAAELARVIAERTAAGRR
jgi:lysophospholipase L1-like esterase